MWCDFSMEQVFEDIRLVLYWTLSYTDKNTRTPTYTKSTTRADTISKSETNGNDLN